MTRLVVETLPEHESDLTGSELEEAVDVDIKGFDVYFQSLGNDPLNGPEKAIVKTYLWYKLHREDPHVANPDSPVRV